jgi:hypothetical protein
MTSRAEAAPTAYHSAMPETGSLADWQGPLLWTAIAVGALLLLVALVILRKGRRRPGQYVYRASRLSKGNRIFPSQVIITPTSITHFHPQFIGKLEKSIHMAHIASIKIDTNVIFSNVFIETTGGQNPIACYGHTRGDALEMKSIIERFQSEYYKASGDASAGDRR